MFFGDKSHSYGGFNLRGELIYHYTSLRDMKCHKVFAADITILSGAERQARLIGGKGKC
ncbi:hypothetical protein PANT111_210045 [Pantoea brenneri]|uniref:Uncharacterized protein n=1 Tax=Pantoea brenneri TaxID=472694 RepID=A0AAX3J803_9GAMM|nr:hypothetical protein PANT111_210045 [Pantoea brenneri]